ncbi:MAG: hypothetical protein WB392_02850 [Methanotrichaceae archaeon]
MRACLALLIVIVVLASPSFAKPSAFEQDNSGKDLQDLESMLSGEHRGAQYAQNELPNQPSPIGALYDPPYKNVFLNDTFFGDFLREFDADPSLSRANLTWPERLLTGLPYQNTSTIAKPEGTNRHHIKPILVKEPDF